PAVARAISDVQQDRQLVAGVPEHGDVLPAVAIEVAAGHRDRGRVGIDAEDRCSGERRITVAGKQRYVCGSVVGGDEVGLAVAVEIAGRKSERPRTNTVLDNAGKASVAIAA